MENKTIIVTCSGEKDQGKDTLCDYLLQILSKKYNCIKISLADRLKLICQRLIKLFYNVDIPIEEFYDRVEKERERPDMPLFNGNIFTLRRVLQQVGTQVIREYIWEDIWCDILYKEYIESGLYDFIFIPDCRFLNEFSYFVHIDIKTSGNESFSFYIKRDVDSESKNQHESEKSVYLIEERCNVSIDNSGSIDDLYSQLDMYVGVIEKMKDEREGDEST